MAQLIIRVSQEQLLDYLAEQDEALYSLDDWDLAQVFLGSDYVEFTVKGDPVGEEGDFPEEEQNGGEKDGPDQTLR